MPTLALDKVNRIIQIALPDTTITVQQLINAIRDWEDELVNLEAPKVADATGKDDLGGGLATGITLRLLNWKVKFADRSGPNYIDCEVKEGNLTAVDQNGVNMNPIQPAAYITVTRSVAVSAARVADVAEWTQTEKDSLAGNLARALGLAQENFYIDNPTFDSNGNMTAARMRIYASSDEVPNGTPVATYNTVATYNSNKKMQTYQVTKQ